jgi:hypothetical protein
MTTCFLVLFGSTTSSAQSYEILSINPLQSSQSKPYKYISPNVTPTQKNNVSTMLSQAGISDLFDTINNPLLPQSEGDYQWHTFYGSNLPDEGYGVASDVSGGVFIVGMSSYTWNGPDGQEPLNSHSGEGDLTILKLDKSGSYKWHTFFGSDSYDDAVDIVIGDSGAVYIVGSSGGSWNGPDGQAPLHSFSGVADITVLKLDDSGAYQWHTFYGSNMGESSTGITLDSIDDVYINIHIAINYYSSTKFI